MIGCGADGTTALLLVGMYNGIVLSREYDIVLSRKYLASGKYQYFQTRVTKTTQQKRFIDKLLI